MSIRTFIDKRFPQLARGYRFIRDQRAFSRRKMRSTAFGFDFIGGDESADYHSVDGELKLFRELLLRTDLFVDVGANCGLFTLIAGKAGIRTLAFEPNLENYRFLLENLHHNRITTVEAFQIALSKDAGVLPLFGGGELASLEPNWCGVLNTYSRLVAVNTLDHLVTARFAQERLLIKIDVEGHEFDVLRGAGNLLKRSPAPVWLLEHGYKENFDGKVNPHFQELFDFFWRNGYACFTADGGRRKVLPEDVSRWLAQGARDFGFLNYLFSKDSIGG
jgi:FkbM family methyltransferase